MKSLCVYGGLLVLALGAVSAPGGWSTDCAENLLVADRASEQVIPKVAGTPDGGCYIAWFDLAFGGYQVYLQRLDARGNELWPHNGILVSDNPQDSWLTDWDMLCDSAGNAVLTFVDIRAAEFDVYAYRIDPDGVFLWGADGIALSENEIMDYTPRLAETSDDAFVFAWTSDEGIRIQKVTAAGEKLFAGDGLLITGTGGDLPGFPRVVAAEDGGFILSWVRTIAWSGSKHVRGQKFDALGQPQWGANPLSIFDAGSVPMAYQPLLVSDGAGGAIYAWHFGGYPTPFDSRVQHIDAEGNELFAHNGLSLSQQSSHNRADPTIVYAADTGDLYGFWVEYAPEPDSWRGLYGQRVSAAGSRMWGSSGVQIAPIDPDVDDMPHAVLSPDGATVFYLVYLDGTMITPIVAARLDAAGGFVWGPKDISSCESSKSRIPVTAGPTGMAVVAWEDDRGASPDVYAQNVNLNGTLGNLGDLNCDQAVNAFDIDPFVLALTSPDEYAAAYPDCDWLLADVNNDAAVNAFDIDVFVAALTGP